jgi:hypothetical protein
MAYPLAERFLDGLCRFVSANGNTLEPHALILISTAINVTPNVSHATRDFSALEKFRWKTDILKAFYEQRIAYKLFNGFIKEKCN